MLWWLELISCIPAFVGSFRGEFVAAAAVWGVAKGSVRGGGAWFGSHNTANSPNCLRGTFRGFVGTTLDRKVAAHSFYYLLYHLILKLWKTEAEHGILFNRKSKIKCSMYKYCFTAAVKFYLLHVWSKPHRRGLIIWFVPLVIFYCYLHENTPFFS